MQPGRGPCHCAAYKQRFCRINNSDCRWEPLQLKQMFHVDKQGLGKEFLSHCSFFSISTTHTWQQFPQYSCLLQANLFNPGSQVSFHKSNPALDKPQSQSTLAAFLGGNASVTMRDAGPIVLKLVHCHNTLRKTARAGDFFFFLNSALTALYRESHMWHFSQGIHLQMKHLGESPEFSWGSSSM